MAGVWVLDWHLRMGVDAVQLDRVYRLYVDGTGPGVDVWAGHSVTSGLATAGQQIRVRYRADLGQKSRWRDSAGRVWRTNEVAEVGRNHWLDVGLSTYDVDQPAQVALPAWPQGRQPVGWNLQWRNGAGARDVFDPAQYVAQLVIGGTGIVNGQRQFDAVIPSPGWAVASGVGRWLDPARLVVPATAEGSTLTGIALGVNLNRETVATVANNNLEAGRNFPTVQDATFLAQGSGFGAPTLATGQVITIAERA